MIIVRSLLDYARHRWENRRRDDAGDVLGEVIIIGIVVGIALALGVVLWNVYNRYVGEIDQ